MFITIGFEDIEAAAELNPTITAEKLFKLLPLDSTANVSRGFLYFSVPLACGLECPTLVLETGDITYWPDGQAVMVFFGRTELSKTARPIPPGLVTKIGRLISDVNTLKDIHDKQQLRIKAAK